MDKIKYTGRNQSAQVTIKRVIAVLFVLCMFVGGRQVVLAAGEMAGVIWNAGGDLELSEGVTGSVDSNTLVVGLLDSGEPGEPVMAAEGVIEYGGGTIEGLLDIIGEQGSNNGSVIVVTQKVYVKNSIEVDLRGCTIQIATPSTYGALFDVSPGVDFKLSNGFIEGTKGPDRQSSMIIVHNPGGVLSKGSITLEGMSFRNHENHDGGTTYNGNGGVINICEGITPFDVTISGCTFENITVTQKGGVVYMTSVGYNDSRLVMQNHSGHSGKDTLWEEFLREHPDYGNTEMTVGRSYRTKKSIHVKDIYYDCNNMILDMKDWLEGLEDRRESLLEIGDDAAVRKVDDEIADCKMQINRLRRKIEAPHKKVKELVLHDVYHKRLASVGKILKLKEQNNMLEDWLRSQECLDANGKRTTYWDLFLADQPDGEMWDYFD